MLSTEATLGEPPGCILLRQNHLETNKQMCLYDLCEVQGQGKQINGDVKSNWGWWHQLGRDMREP